MSLFAIDAGHGGYDNGASYEGRLEKDDNLRLALAVRDELIRLGQDVVMTRDTDVFVPLDERANIANNAGADLFISLHCNSVGYAQNANTAKGTEVYYYEEIAGPLASTLSAHLAGYTQRTNRGAKRSNYRVTLNTFAPSVLVEMGFLTNPAEYDSMASKQGIYQTANAIGDGVLEFFG